MPTPSNRQNMSMPTAVVPPQGQPASPFPHGFMGQGMAQVQCNPVCPNPDPSSQQMQMQFRLQQMQMQGHGFNNRFEPFAALGLPNYTPQQPSPTGNGGDSQLQSNSGTLPNAHMFFQSNNMSNSISEPRPSNHIVSSTTPMQNPTSEHAPGNHIVALGIPVPDSTLGTGHSPQFPSQVQLNSPQNPSASPVPNNQMVSFGIPMPNSALAPGQMPPFHSNFQHNPPQMSTNNNMDVATQQFIMSQQLMAAAAAVMHNPALVQAFSCLQGFQNSFLGASEPPLQASNHQTMPPQGSSPNLHSHVGAPSCSVPPHPPRNLIMPMKNTQFSNGVGPSTQTSHTQSNNNIGALEHPQTQAQVTNQQFSPHHTLRAGHFNPASFSPGQHPGLFSPFAPAHFVGQSTAEIHRIAATHSTGNVPFQFRGPTSLHQNHKQLQQAQHIMQPGKHQTEKVAETRFASNTIVLKRLVKVRESLASMVISQSWSLWRQSSTKRTTNVKLKILDDAWWEQVEYLLSFTKPIMSMIRYTDIDHPCLGEVYDGIDSMLEKMKHVINEKEQDPEETFFKEVQTICVERWNKMTTPLHLLEFALTPKFYSDEILSMPSRVPPYRDAKVSEGCRKALTKLFPDREMENIVTSEFADFVASNGQSASALRDKYTKDAHAWWYLNGHTSPHLQTLAIKLLSQSNSSEHDGMKRNSCTRNDIQQFQNGVCDRGNSSRIGGSRVSPHRGRRTEAGESYPKWKAESSCFNSEQADGRLKIGSPMTHFPPNRIFNHGPSRFQKDAGGVARLQAAALVCKNSDCTFDSKNHMQGHIKCHVKCDEENCSSEASGKIVKEHKLVHHGNESSKRAAPPKSKESIVEIQQWRDERKRNYPIEANIKRKAQEMQERRARGELIDDDSKIRRERMKEILSRQAELGFPVAEVPFHYLSDVPQKSGTRVNCNNFGKPNRSENSSMKIPRINNLTSPRSILNDVRSFKTDQTQGDNTDNHSPEVLCSEDNNLSLIPARADENCNTKDNASQVNIKTEDILVDEVHKAEKGQKVCIFFQRGRCLKGKRCTYLHVRGSNATRKGTTVASEPPARTTVTSKLPKRKPTLLEKLLSGEIKKEKSHLLQVFRFMVNNKFFTEWSNKPLKFFHWTREAPDANPEQQDERQYLSNLKSTYSISEEQENLNEDAMTKEVAMCEMESSRDDDFDTDLDEVDAEEKVPMGEIGNSGDDSIDTDLDEVDAKGKVSIGEIERGDDNLEEGEIEEGEIV